MAHRSARGLWIAGLLLWSSGPLVAQPVPLRLLVSNGVKAALVAAAPACETQTGTRVEASFNTSTALKAEAASGEPFDIVFMTTEVVDDLATSGVVDPRSRQAVARTRIGVGVKEGAAVPDLRSADAVRAALVRTRSVTYATDGASRPFLARMFERLGVADQVAAKTHPEQGSTRATARVVDGQTDMVLTLVSEIVPVPGLRLAGTLPAEFQGEVVFAAAVGTKSTRASHARQLVVCLTAASTEKAYAAVGLERMAPAEARR